MKKKIVLHSFLVVSIGLLLISCGTGLHYSKSADNSNTQIISEAQALISKSSESYSSHAAEVDSLKAHIDKIVQDENTRKKNEATNAMWAAVQKDKDNLYAYLDLWKQQGSVSPAAVTEIKIKILAILNVIDTWEQRKKDGPLYNK